MRAKGSFDAAAFIDRIGQRLVGQVKDAKAATSPSTVGAAVEMPVRKQMEQVLPRGIAVGSGFVIDASGRTSRQMDVVLYEREICPVFSINETPETTYYPCEGVIAVGEIKSSLDRRSLRDAFEKIASVKGLERHDVCHPIPHPETGRPIPMRRAYGTVQQPETIPFRDCAVAESLILGFVLAGDIRLKPEEFCTAYAECARAAGHALSPNLAAALSGHVLRWGSFQKRATTEVVRGPDGRYSRRTSRPQTVPPTSPEGEWQLRWSAMDAQHLIYCQDRNPFRAIVRCIQRAFIDGETSGAAAFDRYLEPVGEPERVVAFAVEK